jgi:hypothetical protein
MVEKKPPSVITLVNGDTIIIRKKHFRFEYGVDPTISTAVDTPTKGVPVKPKSSRRLSLVPVGKTFNPGTPAKSSTTGESRLGGEARLDGVRSAAELEPLNGEDGDRIYVEEEELENDLGARQSQAVSSAAYFPNRDKEFLTI